MRVCPISGAGICTEAQMQAELALFLSMRPHYQNKWPYEFKVNIYTEVGIPEIGRISDIIVRVSEKKIINIECKLENYTIVIQQAQDHLKWADYSYICFFADAYFPARDIAKLVKLGIGLIFWRPGIFVEAVHSYYNTYKYGMKNRHLRRLVNSKLMDKKPLHKYKA